MKVGKQSGMDNGEIYKNIAIQNFSSSDKEILKEKEKIELFRKVFAEINVLKNLVIEPGKVGMVGRGASAFCFKCTYSPTKKSELSEEDEILMGQKLVLKLYQFDDELEKKIERGALYCEHHPNVVQTILHRATENINWKRFPNFKGCKTGDGKGAFILMLHHGITLSKYISLNQNKLGLFNALEIIRSLLNGVLHLRRHHYVHRDLHKENILVDVIDGKGCVKIVDFDDSLSTRKSINGPRNVSPELDGSLGDIVEYKCSKILEKTVSPEVIAYQKGIEKILNYEKSDVYSVGKISESLLKMVPPDEFPKHLLPKINEFFDLLRSKSFVERITLENATEGIDNLIRVCKNYTIEKKRLESEIPGFSMEDYVKKFLAELDFSHYKTNENEVSCIHSVSPNEGKIRTFDNPKSRISFTVTRSDGCRRLVSPPSVNSLKFGGGTGSFMGVNKNYDSDYDGKFFVVSKVPYNASPGVVDVSLGFSRIRRTLLLKKGYRYINGEEEDEGEEEEEEENNKDNDGNCGSDDNNNKKEEGGEDKHDKSPGNEKRDGGSSWENVEGTTKQSDVDLFGGDLLLYNAANNRLDNVKYLVKKRGQEINVTNKDLFGLTPILVSKSFGYHDIVAYLCSTFDTRGYQKAFLKKLKEWKEDKNKPTPPFPKQRAANFRFPRMVYSRNFLSEGSEELEGNLDQDDRNPFKSWSRIASINPSSGPLDGGNLVSVYVSLGTIWGMERFLNQLVFQVEFGRNPCTFSSKPILDRVIEDVIEGGQEYISHVILEVEAPKGDSVGSVDVTISTMGSNITARSGYTYVDGRLPSPNGEGSAEVVKTKDDGEEETVEEVVEFHEEIKYVKVSE